jgi:hypothetical protein
MDVHGLTNVWQSNHVKGENRMGNKQIIQSLHSVWVGAQFVYRTTEMFGPDYRGRKPPFEGQTVTVLGFKPRYKNDVVVEDPTGTVSLMPLEMVERALRSQRETHANGEVIRGEVQSAKKRFNLSTRGEAQKQHLFTAKSGCQASRSNRNYVPCGKAVTHVLEFTDEERRKRLLICKNHASQVDERTILDGWCDVSVTPL